MLKWILALTFIFNFGWASEALDKGISLFHQKKYDEALVVFQQTEFVENERINFLVGQLFCNVALGHFEKIDPTLQLIDFKVQEFTNCNTPPQKGPPTAEQQQMAYMCRRHIREIANQMRETVEKLVRETVPGIFQKVKMLRQLYPFIDAIEQIGIDCCKNNFPWACCMDPMLEQLESWKTLGLPTK